MEKINNMKKINNTVTVKVNADTSDLKEKLAEIEQEVDRIAEKISRMKISLTEIIQTADRA